MQIKNTKSNFFITKLELKNTKSFKGLRVLLDRENIKIIIMITKKLSFFEGHIQGTTTMSSKLTMT